MARKPIISLRPRAEIAADLRVERDRARLARYELDRVRADLDLIREALTAFEIELAQPEAGK